MVKVSIIVSYYKALDNLEIILNALNCQSKKDFEVIISEDDNNKETFVFLEENWHKYNFQILHTNQEEDNGFRKTTMLNKSIKIANGEIMVFIDGDCVPHKHFVKSYIKNIEENVVLKGRRVMLSETITLKLKKTINFKYLSILKILFSRSKKKKNGLYNSFFNLSYKSDTMWLLGCNWGIYKDLLYKVNGFDEDYVRASVGEDNDIEWRLKKIGVRGKSLKNKAIVYHLYHKGKYSKEDLFFNKRILKNKKEKNKWFCENGLKK